MKTYPGRKKIEKVRHLAEIHKEAEEVCRKLTNDFIDSLYLSTMKNTSNEELDEGKISITHKNFISRFILIGTSDFDYEPHSNMSNMDNTSGEELDKGKNIQYFHKVIK